MPLSIGIVGLPNVGKSTLFNALVKARQAQASNFAFCTIEPNVGIVEVPDPRLERLAKIANSARIIPATIEFIDIAGLVKKAHQGEGLGNQFLARIRETDAIIIVLRCFDDPEIIHIEGKISPKDDYEIIKTELELADLQTKEKIDKKNPTTDFVQYLTDKPILYAANTAESEAGLKPAEIITKYQLDFIKDPNKLIVVSAKVEQDLIDLTQSEQKEYLSALGIENSALDRLIQNGYRTLDLETFFSAEPKETRAWVIQKNSTAPVAAGRIHTDFQKGFIRAEVIGYDEYINYNGEQGAKLAGKMRSEGKDYIVQDGDVIRFRFQG